MNNKTTTLSNKKSETVRIIHCIFSKKRSMNLYTLVVLLLTSAIVLSLVSYFIGYKDSKMDIDKKITELEHQKQNYELMQEPIGMVQERFWKFLMIVIMDNIAVIGILLLLGWVLHGIF